MSARTMNEVQKNLPIGDSTLTQIRARNAIYVDKTQHLLQIINSGRYFFLSRPRRFGKSLTIDTLKQLFLGNKALFKDTFAESNWNWDVTYPVIHLSFGGSSAFESEKTLIEIIHNQIAETAQTYAVEVTGKSIAVRFHNLIGQIKEKYKTPIVLLTDEYDKPILDVITDEHAAIRNREILKGLYSVIKDNDNYLKFVFLTGVSKFSKVSLFSGLNNLEDISLQPAYADICGYTQNELESSFSHYLSNVNLKKLKKWYNGYNFAGSSSQKVYNPFDILLFLRNDQNYKNYWFETGTPSFLVKLISQRREIVPSLESYEASLDALNTIDVNNLPIAALMFQSGYLTIKEQFTFGEDLWYRLGYPNFEVKTALNKQLTKIGITQEDATYNQLSLNKALITNDWQQLENAFQGLFSAIPYHFYTNTPIHNYEAYYCAIVYSYFAALGYDVRLEEPTSQGRIDMSVVINDIQVIIFEFKVTNDKDLSKKALQQIIDKNYAHKFLHLDLPIYQVGISFDQNTRAVNGFVVELFNRIYE